MSYCVFLVYESPFFFSLYTQIAIYPLQTGLIFNNDNRDNAIFYQIKLFQRWLFLAKQFDVSLYKYLSTIIYWKQGNYNSLLFLLR